MYFFARKNIRFNPLILRILTQNHFIMPNKDTEPVEPMRLQKYLAHRGVASRRAIEALIESQEVTVNGQIASLGMKIDPTKDHVIVQGKRIKPGGLLKELTTFMVHKPQGYVCSHKDPHLRNKVFELLPPSYRKKKFICAGRLDKDSEGLAILTTDGELAQKLMHPSFGVIKKYDVTLETPFDPEKLAELRAGIWDEGEHLAPTKVIPMRTGPTRRFEIHLSEGKKREIRRLFAAFKYTVRKLKRVQIGQLKLGPMPVGGCKKLSEADIALLFK